jgi:nucleotide-binding universal stress UspA family protein
MAKKILVALDYSENASRAIEFLADTFSPDHEILLFSVIPNTATVCDLEADTLVPQFSSQQKAFCQLEDEKRVALGVALKNAKEALVKAGFDENKIEVKASQQKKGIARDIVAEADHSKADIVVMGRRGISSFKEFFLGSVSQKVLQLSKEQSILLVQ